MDRKKQIVAVDRIQDRIFTIRGVQVMLDRDLASAYDVETRVLNQAVKRNIARFPVSFRFQLTKEELSNLRSQIVTSSFHGGIRYLPYVFTEQGVAMLSAVLKSETAVKVSIKIMQAFVEMRRFMLSNVDMFKKIDCLEVRQLQTEKKVDAVLEAIGTHELKSTQGIFYNGQIFDAYTFAADLIRSAKKSITLIDNYVNDTVLTLFAKRKKGVAVMIYTNTISKQLRLDLQKHNIRELKLRSSLRRMIVF
jgi:ribosomal protein L4